MQSLQQELDALRDQMALMQAHSVRIEPEQFQGVLVSNDEQRMESPRSVYLEESDYSEDGSAPTSPCPSTPGSGWWGTESPLKHSSLAEPVAELSIDLPPHSTPGEVQWFRKLTAKNNSMW